MMTNSKMKGLVSMLNLLVILGVDGQQCFVPGQCVNSTFVGEESNVSNYNGCLKACQDHRLPCNWFTYSVPIRLCLLFADCESGPVDNCENCFTGEASCLPTDLCSLDGLIEGHLLQPSTAVDRYDCLVQCQRYPEQSCRWYTFDTNGGFCFLLSDFGGLDTSCETCISGPVTCQVDKTTWTKLMVVGGHGNRDNHSEVVDLSKTDQTCEIPQSFPAYNGIGVFGTTLDGNPVACGGYGSSSAPVSDCWRYEKRSNTWQGFPSMNDGRSGSGTAMINDSAWIVVGGYQSESSFEIFQAGQWEYHEREDLDVAGHCLLKINTTHLFITNPSNQSASIFSLEDPDTRVNLESSPDIHYYQACGLVTKDSGELEVVVAGGRQLSNMAYDTCSILSLTSLTWRQGPSLPHAVQDMASVQYGSSFVILGGFDPQTNDMFTNILLFNSSSSPSWVVLPQSLTHAKGSSAAFLVPDEAVNC